MFFDTWDAEKIFYWKRQIAMALATKEGLRAEILHHFARQGHPDPDAVLTNWNDIMVIQDGSGLWTATVHRRSPAHSACSTADALFSSMAVHP